MENIETHSELNDNLTLRLENWVNERPFLSINQKKVRQNIANAITTDILNPVGSQNLPARLEKYRGHVDAATTNAINILNNLPIGENGVAKTSPLTVDNVTGTKFITQIKRVGNVWISEEVGENGELISQAKIGDKGELVLTLNFSGPRYEEKGANPKMIERSEFPTGTKVLFLNHAASLGIINWKGK
jgi:hypothetical protein